MDLARTEAGQFVKGQSGNPAGRPKQRHIRELQQDLEIAVREGLDVERVHRIVNKMAEMAEAGNTKAAKLLLDKIISNAQSSDDGEQSNGRTVVFRIENALIEAPSVSREKPLVSVEIIDASVTSGPAIPEISTVPERPSVQLSEKSKS